MKDDPILARIRAVRHQISEQCQHDVQRLIDHYIEREQQHHARCIELTDDMPPEKQLPKSVTQESVETAS